MFMLENVLGVYSPFSEAMRKTLRATKAAVLNWYISRGDGLTDLLLIGGQLEGE